MYSQPQTTIRQPHPCIPHAVGLPYPGAAHSSPTSSSCWQVGLSGLFRSKEHALRLVWLAAHETCAMMTGRLASLEYSVPFTNACTHTRISQLGAGRGCGVFVKPCGEAAHGAPLRAERSGGQFGWGGEIAVREEKTPVSSGALCIMRRGSGRKLASSSGSRVHKRSQGSAPTNLQEWGPTWPPT